MKDYFNNELAIGDTVAFYQPGYRNFILGKVVDFTPKKVRVNYMYQNYEHTYLADPDMFIKKPKAL